MNSILEAIKTQVRAIMRIIAKALNKISGGKITPNSVTIVGLLAHVPIAYLIATRHPLWGALLLVIFGLFDTLDGELARLQHRTSPSGMLLDSVTDRMKEVIIYVGIAYYFVAIGLPYYSVWAAAALGASVVVSYINAWGEAVMAHASLAKQTVNQVFRGGLLRFEVRMFLLVVGLALGGLRYIVPAIAILASITALQRLYLVMKGLRHV